MSFLKNITISICTLSLVYSIFMLLTPDRFQRQVKIIISLITAAVIGSMLLGIKELPTDMFSLEIPKTGDSFISRQDLVVKELEAELTKQIALIFSENDIPTENIYLKTDIDEDNCIFISELVITVKGGRESYGEKAESIVKSRIGDVNHRIMFTEDADEF